MPRIKECTETKQRCSTCKEMKLYAEFYVDNSMKNGYSPYCKECQRGYDKKYQQTEKYRIKVRRQLWRRQGINITYNEYLSMLEGQGGKCAICDKIENQFGKGMCVDHDHVTGAVRGILCTDCNMGIGNLKDDVDLLRRALAYLEEHNMKVIV